MTQSDFEQFSAQLDARSKQDYRKLLNVLAQAMRVSSPLVTIDVEDRERLSMAQGLSNKFIEHAVTILHLSSGTNLDLPSFRFSFVDLVSMNVLTRASFEAFLTFHYVFYSPQTKEEADFRYLMYKATGILERHDFPTVIEKFEKIRLEDEKELTQIREKLETNAVFQSLNKRQRTRFFAGKELNLWRWDPSAKKVLSWREIAIHAKLGEMIASHVYRLLAGQAHSSFLSVLQSLEARKSESQEKDIIFTMAVMNPVTANMVREYCGLFPEAQEAFRKDIEGSGIVNWWLFMGRMGRTLEEVEK
jgi:hypothetical protein